MKKVLKGIIFVLFAIFFVVALSSSSITNFFLGIVCMLFSLFLLFLLLNEDN